MSRKWMLLAGVGLGLIGTPGLGQETAAADGADAAGLGDIIVTAQKRAQNVQDVPIAVSVVGGDALEKTGGSQLQDLAKLAPGLTMTTGDQPANNSIIMRGIGTFAFSIGVEPSVLVVVDDVAVGLQAQAFSDLADIERVEVLRGPQSTLFGKAASAGVISITTKAPSKHLTANADVMVTDDDEQRYSVGLSGPLGKVVSFRANATIGRFDGNVRELNTGRMINGRNSENYRVKLMFEPSSNFDATLIGHYTKVTADCCEFAPIFLTPGANFFGTPGSVAYVGVTPRRGNFDLRIAPIPTARAKDRGVSLKMNLGVGDFTLTSITALNKYELADMRDFDRISTDPLLGVAGGLRQFGTFEADTLSQELRLTSPSGGPLQYLIGAYYAGNDFARRFTRVGPISSGDWLGETSSDVYALFAQGDYKVTEGTRLIGGLRVSREDIAFRYRRFLSTATNPPFFTSGNDSDSVITGKAGIQQDLAPDVMAFATYTRGYKGQAYDLTSSFNRPDHPARNPVKPEHSDSYELGLKSMFLDRRVLFNLTAFQTDYSNFQSQTQEPSLGGAFILANVGSLRTRGVEAEWVVRPLETLSLNGSAAYLDAKIKSYPRGQCYFGQTAAQGCVGGFQDLSGKRLNNAPKWKLNAAANLDVPLEDLPFDAFLNASFTWQSKINYVLTQDPALVEPSHGIVNLSLGIQERGNERYKLTFFVRNLFNKHYYSALQNDSSFANPAGRNTERLIDGIPARDSSRYFGARLAVQY